MHLPNKLSVNQIATLIKPGICPDGIDPIVERRCVFKLKQKLMPCGEMVEALIDDIGKGFGSGEKISRGSGSNAENSI